MGADQPGRRPQGRFLSSEPLRRFIYGRRLGPRLRPGRRRLLDERLPGLRIELPDIGRLEPGALFGTPGPIWLEIGFGAGEHLAAQAAAHPEIGIIGCEPFISGVARLLAEIEIRQLSNVRLVVDDARLLLNALPDRSLSRIFVLFPDPWPKTRHHKRRIVNPTAAAAFARLLEAGGQLRLATDDPGYARFMLETLLARPEFAWSAERAQDWRQRAADWPPTRYEEKAITAGRSPIFLSFVRNTSPPCRS